MTSRGIVWTILGILWIAGWFILDRKLQRMGNRRRELLRDVKGTLLDTHAAGWRRPVAFLLWTALIVSAAYLVGSSLLGMFKRT